MTTRPIVAGVDGSEPSLRAVEWAAREAVLRGSALRIVSAPVLPPRMSLDPAGHQTVTAVIHRAARDALAQAADRATGLEPALTVRTEVLPGPPMEALLRQAAGASLLVLGWRGAGGFAAMVLGSVSRYLATHAPCPVVLAREETVAAHREIVVGIRDPGGCAGALGYAFDEAAARNARLVAVHAWFWPGVQPAGTLADALLAAFDPGQVPAAASDRLEAAIAPWREKYPAVRCGLEIVRAHPAQLLAARSGRADLTVLGRRPGGLAARSVIHGVLGHAHGPVATVPAG